MSIICSLGVVGKNLPDSRNASENLVRMLKNSIRVDLPIVQNKLSVILPPDKNSTTTEFRVK